MPNAIAHAGPLPIDIKTRAIKNKMNIVRQLKNDFLIIISASFFPKNSLLTKVLQT
ncbi:MAG: hypothetical protein ACE5KA_03685 [Nitrososphaerales archaeon]